MVHHGRIARQVVDIDRILVHPPLAANAVQNVRCDLLIFDAADDDNSVLAEVDVEIAETHMHVG